MNARSASAEPRPSADGTVIDPDERVMPTCSRCEQTPIGEYWCSADATFCAECTAHVRAHGPGSAEGGFLRALGYGFATALGCSIGWYAILALTGYELSLLGIAVGFAVGTAVRKGSGGRGGWKYQLLAIVLVYGAIVSSYVPLLLEGAEPAENGLEALIQLVLAFVIAPALPFVAGAENLIGILIIGVGLFEGWKLNKRDDPVFQGPYEMPARAPAEAPRERSRAA
jgi:hypothetical protein